MLVYQILIAPNGHTRPTVLVRLAFWNPDHHNQFTMLRILPVVKFIRKNQCHIILNIECQKIEILTKTNMNQYHVFDVLGVPEILVSITNYLDIKTVDQLACLDHLRHNIIQSNIPLFREIYDLKQPIMTT